MGTPELPTRTSPSIPLPPLPPIPLIMPVQPLRINRKGRLQIKTRPSDASTPKDESAAPAGAPFSVRESPTGYSAADPPFIPIDSPSVPDYGPNLFPSLSTVTKPQHGSTHIFLASNTSALGLANSPWFHTSIHSSATSASSPASTPGAQSSLTESIASIEPSANPRISRQSSRVRFSDELDVKIFSQGTDDRVLTSTALAACPGRSAPEHTQLSPKSSSTNISQPTDSVPLTGQDTMGNNLREFRSNLRASSSSRMTSSASLSNLSTIPSSALTLPSSSSLSAMDKLDSADDFSPRELRYPRLSKSMARLSQSSIRSTPARPHKTRSAKSSTSPKSMTLSIPPTPRSAGFPSTPISAPPTSSRSSPIKSSVPGHDLRDVLQRATFALASSPSKRSPAAYPSPSSANGSVRSKSSKRDSFASIASTLFSNDGSVLTEGSSAMSTSTSSTSISSSTLSTDAGHSALLTPKVLRIWAPETNPTDPDAAEETPLAGLYGFPLPPASTPVRPKAFPSISASVTPPPPVKNSGHERTDSNLSAILDWTPSRHVRADSSLSFIHDFPIPPSRPTLQVVIADTDTPESKRVLAIEHPPSPGPSSGTPLKAVDEESEDTPRPKAIAKMDSPASMEEPTMLPYLAPSASLDDGAESDLDLSAPLIDVALRSNIISPNSRLNRFSISSRRSSDGGPFSTPSPQSPMFRTVSTPGSSRSSRSSVRSSTTTLRPLSLSSRHSGEGWSGSESEEEEFISAIQNISIRRLSAPRLKRIPSLMARPKTLRSATSPASLSPRPQTLKLDGDRTNPRSPLAGASPRTPSTARSSSYRLSGQSQMSNSTCSEVESALLTPCPSGETPTSSEDLPSPTKSRCGVAESSGAKTETTEHAKPRLPKPTRRVEGWGMPEILIDEDWSSGDDTRPWSSDEEFERDLSKGHEGEGDWLLSEEI